MTTPESSLIRLTKIKSIVSDKIPMRVTILLTVYTGFSNDVLVVFRVNSDLFKGELRDQILYHVLKSALCFFHFLGRSLNLDLALLVGDVCELDVYLGQVLGHRPDVGSLAPDDVLVNPRWSAHSCRAHRVGLGVHHAEGLTKFVLRTPEGDRVRGNITRWHFNADSSFLQNFSDRAAPRPNHVPVLGLGNFNRHSCAFFSLKSGFL